MVFNNTWLCFLPRVTYLLSVSWAFLFWYQELWINLICTIVERNKNNGRNWWLLSTLLRSGKHPLHSYCTGPTKQGTQIKLVSLEWLNITLPEKGTTSLQVAWSRGQTWHQQGRKYNPSTERTEIFKGK